MLLSVLLPSMLSEHACSSWQPSKKVLSTRIARAKPLTGASIHQFTIWHADFSL